MPETKKPKEKAGQVDFILLMTILALLMFGLIMLFSASAPSALQDGNIYSAIVKQGGLAVLGLVCMLVMANYDYHYFKKFAKGINKIAIALMIIVPVIGFASHGATRQISLGPVSFQPSEVAKFAIVVYFAARFSDKETANLKTDRNNVGSCVVILAVYCAACLMQSHMSAAVVLGVIGFLMMIVAGLPMRYFYMLGGAGVAFLAGVGLTASYRLDRIKALWDPFAYERGIGWQIIQSLYAVGSGGLFGLGLGQSRQKFRYLPEAHNDYIYAVICEELGFVGGLLVMALFVVFVWRGISVALNAKDRFGMFLAFGITAVIGIQMLINIGVVLSVLPSTGMQLPFFSAGGTSMLVVLGAMGILLNISRSSKIKKM